MTKIVCLCLFALTTGFLATTSRAQPQAQTPEWIWHPNSGQAATNGEVRLFRKTFTVEGRVNRAVLSVAADDRASISLNGSPAIKVNGFERATRMDVT